jgi:alpha/beta hydrolase family protein
VVAHIGLRSAFGQGRHPPVGDSDALPGVTTAGLVVPTVQGMRTFAEINSRSVSGAPWEGLGLHVLARDEPRGLMVLALGDVDTARHVAVLVPGMEFDHATVEDGTEARRGPLGWARALRSASRAATADTVAVVLWIGGPTRVRGWGRLSGAAVRSAAGALPGFVARLRPARPAPVHLTLLGHGLGAVATALAAPRLDLHHDDDLVLLAAPGARVGSAGELGTPARIWAGRAAADWVRFVPPVRVGDLGHGPDPAAPSFGARPVDVRGVPAHGRYFDPGSPALAALAAIVTGRAAGADRAVGDH